MNIKNTIPTGRGWIYGLAPALMLIASHLDKLEEAELSGEPIATTTIIKIIVLAGGAFLSAVLAKNDNK